MSLFAPTSSFHASIVCFCFPISFFLSFTGLLLSDPQCFFSTPSVLSRTDALLLSLSLSCVLSLDRPSCLASFCFSLLSCAFPQVSAQLTLRVATWATTPHSILTVWVPAQEEAGCSPRSIKQLSFRQVPIGKTTLAVKSQRRANASKNGR